MAKGFAQYLPYILLAGGAFIAYKNKDKIMEKINNLTGKKEEEAPEPAPVSGATATPATPPNVPFPTPAASSTSDQPQVFPLPGGGAIYQGGGGAMPIMTGNPALDAQMQAMANVVPSAHTQIGQTPGGQQYNIVPGSPTIVPYDQPGGQLDYYGMPIGGGIGAVGAIDPYTGFPIPVGPFDPYGAINNPYGIQGQDVYGVPGYTDDFLNFYYSVSGGPAVNISGYPLDDYGEDAYGPPLPPGPIPIPVQVPDDDHGIVVRPDLRRCSEKFHGSCGSECKDGPHGDCLECLATCGLGKGDLRGGVGMGLHLGQFKNAQDWAKDHRKKKGHNKKKKHSRHHSHFATLTGIV